MTRSFPRIAAAAVLAAGGLAIAVFLLAIVAAKVVLATGVPGVVIRPADAVLLDDIAAIAPFIAAFALADLVAALALLTGRPWADRLATAVATVATSVGVFAFILVAVGQDAFTTVPRVAEGLGIIATFTAMYVVALVALAFVGTSDDVVEQTTAPQQWTIPGAA